VEQIQKPSIMINVSNGFSRSVTSKCHHGPQIKQC